jgi:hypothetical protein
MAETVPRQVPFTVTQPPVSASPFTKVEVAEPETAKLVVVAFVVVLFNAVKFWRVVDE